MEQKSMTALVSAFARWYHTQHNDVAVFDDCMAGQLLAEEEKTSIAKRMAEGIGFFNPAFRGTPEEALGWVVNHQLGPTPLGRSAFCERHLENAVRLGARQYLVLAAGYDTFAYRQPAWAKGLEVFEIDHPLTAEDKQQRLKKASIQAPENTHFVPADLNQGHWVDALLSDGAFSRDAISFCSLLGISYYLEREAFARLFSALAEILPKGSSVAFDYPEQEERAGTRTQKQAQLAQGANEAMRASYTYPEIEGMLAENDLLVYEHLAPAEITAQYFKRYNDANPSNPMAAFEHVNYCLAVKG